MSAGVSVVRVPLAADIDIAARADFFMQVSPALYPKIVLDFNFAMLYLLWAWKHKIKSNGHCRDRNPLSIL